MKHEGRQHGGGEKGGRDAHQGAFHAGGKKGFAAPGGAAGKKDPVREAGQGQDHDPDHEKLRGRKRMMAMMLGVIGGDKSAQAEETADEGGGGRDRAVDGGPFHQGTDDAELAAGGIGVGHWKLCTAKL